MGQHFGEVKRNFTSFHVPNSDRRIDDKAIAHVGKWLSHHGENSRHAKDVLKSGQVQVDGAGVKRIWDSKAGVLKETTKTKTIRVIPISNDLRSVLVPLCQGKGLSDFVFPSGDAGNGFSFHHGARTLRYFCRKAGVREVRFHDLRHSFASNFVMAGGNIYDLQRMLGHSSVTMTARYSHLSPDHLNGATEILKYGLGNKANVVPLRRVHGEVI